MVRKLKITVDGKTYDVEVEEIFSTSKQAPIVPKTESKSTVWQSVKEAPKVSPAKEEAVPTPIPGKVVSIKVKPGDVVEMGQVMLILEAMKMENEITAPIGGRIKDILVQEGQTISARDIILIIQ